MKTEKFRKFFDLTQDILLEEKYHIWVVVSEEHTEILNIYNIPSNISKAIEFKSLEFEKQIIIGVNSIIR